MLKSEIATVMVPQHWQEQKGLQKSLCSVL